MNKNILFLSIFLSAFATSKAQNINITPEIGLSAIQRCGSQKQWQPSTKIGVTADFGIKEHFSMETGLYYTLKKYTATAGKFSNEYAEWFDNVSNKRHFLQLPVIAKFKWNIVDNVKMFFGVGPYVALCLKNKVENNPYYINTEYDEKGWEYIYNNYHSPIGTNSNGVSNEFLYDKPYNFDWGLASNFGVETNRFVVKFQYDLSLGKEGKNEVIGANYHSLTLSVGYKFGL